MILSTGMAAWNGRLPEGKRAEQKGQPGVRNVLWDRRYFPCAHGSPKYAGEGSQKDGKAKGTEMPTNELRNQRGVHKIFTLIFLSVLIVLQ